MTIWEKNITTCHWKLILLYGVTLFLNSSGPSLFLNCCQVLIHLWTLRGVIMKDTKAKGPRTASQDFFKKVCLLWCNLSEIRNWHIKTICGTCLQSSQRYNFLLPSCRRRFNRACWYQSFPKFTWLNCSLMNGRFLENK